MQFSSWQIVRFSISNPLAAEPSQDENLTSQQFRFPTHLLARWKGSAMMKMTRRFYRIICQRVLHHLICFANSNLNSKQTVELHWNGTCSNSMLYCIFCPLSIVRNINQKHQTKQNHHQKNQATECKHDCTVFTM